MTFLRTMTSSLVGTTLMLGTAAIRADRAAADDAADFADHAGTRR